MVLEIIAWSLALKAKQNNEKINLEEYTNLQELNFHVNTVLPKEINKIRVRVKHLYDRVNRLNNDIKELINE